MDPWVAWLVAALLLGVLEVLSGGALYLAMLGGGALAGSATAAITENAFLPWVVFAVVSVGLIAVVRPVATKHATHPSLRSGIERLVGENAQVVSEVNGSDGRVKLHGEVWSARSFDGQTVFDPGTVVQVLQIEGATALVA